MPKLNTSASQATIIGAGIIGMSTAVFLQREGFEVTVIDKVPPGEGASFGNAGGVVVSNIVPPVRAGMLLKIPGWLMDPKGPVTVQWRHLPAALPWLLAVGRNALPARVKKITGARAELGLRAVQDHRTILAHAGVPELLAMDDGLHLYSTARQFDDDAGWRAMRAEYGYDGRELSGDEAREIEPDLTPDIYKAVFWDGWHRIVDPFKMVQKLAEQVVRDGGRIVQDEVLGIDQDGTRATRLHLQGAGELAVQNLCVCAGAWSHELARLLGSKVLLQAERGYHVIMQDPGVRLSRAVTHAAQPGAVTPHHDGIKIAGSDEIAANDAPADWRRADQMYIYGKRVLPELRDVNGTETKWMGRRPSTPDSLPVISPSPSLNNVWYGFGHGHMGLSWGPTTGRMIADMMTARTSNTDLAPFHINRSM